METPEVLCVVLGVLILVTRGPLVFAPDATIRVYQKIYSTNARVRVLGIAIVAVGAAILVADRGSPVAALIAGIVALMGALMLLLAAPYRRLVGAVLDFASESIDVRFLGLITVVIGAAPIYVGLS